jgi:hypothetical protein
VGLALGLACASSGGGGGTPTPNDILTAEDIQADRHAWANTFEVVLRLRPEWLEPPDDYDFTDRYYDPATARRHFGLDHRGGVISVETQ